MILAFTHEYTRRGPISRSNSNYEWPEYVEYDSRFLGLVVIPGALISQAEVETELLRDDLNAPGPFFSYDAPSGNHDGQS